MTLFLRDRRGGVATLIGLMSPILVGFAALAIDMANLYYSKDKLQAAADAAAEGAVLLMPSATQVTARALALAGQNVPSNFGTVTKSADVVTGTWDPVARTFTPGGSSQNAVEVLTHRTVANGNPIGTYLAKTLGAPFTETSGQAIAVRFGGACVRLMDPSASGALSAGGSASITTNCPLQVNSSSQRAADVKGSSNVTASSICVSGNYAGNGYSPLPKVGCPTLVDPLAAIAEPTVPSLACGAPVTSGMLQSNCYFSGSISLSGNLTLSGAYYLKGANLTVGSNTTLTGTGVTIFVDANSSLNLGGGGSIDLAAPTSGTYAGIVIFQSRATPKTTLLSLGGGSSLSLNGTVYAPTATLSLSGYSSVAAKIGYAIIDQMTIGGSSSFAFNAFSSNGVTPRTLAVHTGLVQ